MVIIRTSSRNGSITCILEGNEVWLYGYLDVQRSGRLGSLRCGVVTAAEGPHDVDGTQYFDHTRAFVLQLRKITENLSQNGRKATDIVHFVHLTAFLRAASRVPFWPRPQPTLVSPRSVQVPSKSRRFFRDSSLPFIITLSLLNGRCVQLTEHG